MSYKNEFWSPYARVYDPLKIGSIDGTDTELHDNGIARALNVKYKPNKCVVGDPACTLFIGRLNPQTDEDSIMKAFKKYGPIKRCRLVRDIVTGFSKCYAFLEFIDDRVAIHASNSASKLFIDGNEVFVDMECSRTLKGWVPRRLGGGFGGKKESGQLRFGGKDRPFRRPYNLEVKERRFSSSGKDIRESRLSDNNYDRSSRWSNRRNSSERDSTDRHKS